MIYEAFGIKVKVEMIEGKKAMKFFVAWLFSMRVVAWEAIIILVFCLIFKSPDGIA